MANPIKTAKFKKKINGIIYDLNVISDSSDIYVTKPNGQIDTLLAVITTILNDNEQLNNKVAVLEEKVSTLQEQVATLQNN